MGLLFQALVVIGVLLRFGIDEGLHSLYLLERTDIGFAGVDTVLGAEEYIVGSEGEELRRYFGEAVSDGNHIDLSLAATDHQFVDDLFGACREIGTAVVKDNDAALEVMQHTQCPLRVEDMAAHATEQEVVFCPQFVEGIERMTVGVGLVVLGIVGRDDENALACGGTYLLDEGGFACTIGTQDDNEFTGSCGLVRRWLHHLLPQHLLLQQLLARQCRAQGW